MRKAHYWSAYSFFFEFQVYRVTPFHVLLLSGVLSACSTHPLPEDVTDLPIFEIVHRIQCEAASVVKEEHARRGLTEDARKLKKLDARIKTQSKDLSTALQDLKSDSDYGTSAFELIDAFDAVNLQIRQVQQKKLKLQSEPKTPYRDAQLATLALEARQLLDQHAQLLRLGKRLTDTFKLSEDLKDSREEREAFEKVIAFENNKATFQFVFQVTEDNNATSTGTITWPITLGVLTLGYDVGDKKQRASDRRVKLVSSFGELNQFDCQPGEVPEPDRFPRRYPITGEIGLAEVIFGYLKVSSSERGKQKFQTGGESYSDKITFTTALNGSLKPGVNLSKRMGQLIDVKADLTAMRKDVHELTIFLTPAGEPTPPGSAQEIIIRQMPAIRVRGRSVEQSPAG